uniref:Uncharacterized protein n=1 Tax=Plectus sambesii TaxID=2011161 RepID=A0A914VLA5_9BILA
MAYGENRGPVVFAVGEPAGECKSNADTSEKALTEITDDEPTMRWIDDPEARSTVFSTFSGFYALVVVIFSIVLELSHVLADVKEQHDMRIKDLIFGSFMYGGGVVFFVYCYGVLINPKWSQSAIRLKSAVIRQLSTNSLEVDRQVSTDNSSGSISSKVSHSSPTAGCLYLRLGCVVFGVVGIVYYAFSIFSCTTGHITDCDGFTTTLDAFAIIFVFVQMHFIFSNSKMTIHASRNVARWGTMHLVAANLWTWIRYVLLEERETRREIMIFGQLNDTSSSESSESEESSAEDLTADLAIAARVRRSTLPLEDCNNDVESILGGLSEVMYTCIVEYSLIGAAVMFVVWRNVGRPRSLVEEENRRKHQIRVDCSKSTSGLFLGLTFLTLTFVSMAVFYLFINDKLRSNDAVWVFVLTDMMLYFVSCIGCVWAIWRMRVLTFLRKHIKQQNSAELLDRILLVVGVVGELIFSIAGMVGLSGETKWNWLTFCLLLVHTVRLAQVGLQTALLFIAARIVADTEELQRRKPGKQAITFLLVANVALFLMNSFEAQKASVSAAVVRFYGADSWAFLVRGCAPLTIFYRFHSSVCFAEVWKHTYTVKKHETHA